MTIRRVLIFLLLVGALLAPSARALASQIAPTAAPQAAIINGGFETNPSSSGSGWSWPSSGWVWDGDVAHSGTHSTRIARSSGGETASLYSDYIPVQPSTLYTLSYWLRTQNANWFPSVMIYQYTSSRTQTGWWLMAHANISSGTSAWQQFPYRFQTYTNTAYIRLRLYLYTNTTGIFWFDDLTLTNDGATLYPYHPGFPVRINGSIFFTSPVSADINRDGNNELLMAIGSGVYGWDHNGKTLPGFPLQTNDKHIMGHLAVSDLDGDSDLEIVAGTQTAVLNGQGRVFVWQHNGSLYPNWPKNVAWNTVSAHNSSWVGTVALADIDNNGGLEILAGTTNNAAGDPQGSTPVPNLYAWRPNGILMPGSWPNWLTSAGIYGFIAAGDLDGNSAADVIVARDVNFLNAYAANGTSLAGWPIQTWVNDNNGNYNTDYRVEYNYSGPVLADLEGDGEMEYIAAGTVKGPANLDVMLNSALLVFEPDGTRRAGWESAALGEGIIDDEDPSILSPAVADLDLDGKLEIILASYDGWIRAYNPDKTIQWSYNIAQGANLQTCEPVIGDVDGDGALEILICTFVPRQWDVQYHGVVGIIGLEADGTPMAGFPLPVPTPGVRGSLTLDDLDGDGKLEIMAGAREGEVLVWDTPTAFDPQKLPWPTGRRDLLRSATFKWSTPDFRATSKYATPPLADQGESATFTVHIQSTAPVVDTLTLTDEIPNDLTFIPGTLTSSSGVVSINNRVITWSGNLQNKLSVDIHYQVIVSTHQRQVVRNQVALVVPNGVINRTGTLCANCFVYFFPLINR